MGGARFIDQVEEILVVEGFVGPPKDNQAVKSSASVGVWLRPVLATCTLSNSLIL